MSNCDLLCVEPALLDEVWPIVRHFIRSALDKAQLGDFAVLERQVFAAEALLWVVWSRVERRIKAAVVTQVAVINNNKYCTIVACGGINLALWLPLLAQLETYARDQSCIAMRIFGRPGWKRLLPGYGVRAYVLERTL
jgi:hypothetical protein